MAQRQDNGLLNLWNPDKHLRIHSPRLRLALRMSWYCMVLSSVGGCLFALAFLLDFPNPDAENIKQSFILALFFGVGTALIPRLFASILIGAAMAIVTGKFPKPNDNPWAYKFVMGLTASAIVHLFAPINLVRFTLSELTGGVYSPSLETASLIAVYAVALYLSQVMAGTYLQEASPDGKPR